MPRHPLWWSSLMLPCVCAVGQNAPRLAEPWQAAYQDDDATGAHVIALWRFDPGNEAIDNSGHGHDLALRGSQFSAAGRFSACLEGFPGWPVEDKAHGAEVANSPALTPQGAFTLELWLMLKAEFADYGQSFLLDKKYVDQTDYQWLLSAADRSQNRSLRVVLGYGADSATYASDAAVFEPDVWYHLAFTYDGAGHGRFYRNAVPLGGTDHPERGAIAPGKKQLVIGDRIGSYFGGFPGFIDQVRLSNGVLEFQPVRLRYLSERTAFVRREPDPRLRFGVVNQQRTPLGEAKVLLGLAGGAQQVTSVAGLDSGAEQEVELSLDTSLRPGDYQLSATVELAGDEPFSGRVTFPLTIVPRPLPQVMPVVMWGVGGLDEVVDELPRLQGIGFDHCLGLSCDYQAIWDAGQPVPPLDGDKLEAGRLMLDTCLAHGFHVTSGLSPGRWARGADGPKRVDRDGKEIEHPQDIAALHPDYAKFCYNVGASMAQAWGSFPAWDSALLHTEVRGESRPSFNDFEREAFKAAAGIDIPAEVPIGWNLLYSDLPAFPEDRIIPDDNPIYLYYRWWWQQGDGWNGLETALDNGLKTMNRPGFWTFHDPAARVAKAWGSGGNVDYLSHWTYSYPDPIRIGLCAEELLAMAAGAAQPQQVMKMTQIIWYRSQTAPEPAAGEVPEYRAEWELRDPTAPFITIAPMHLREAFWAKIARPIKGIMYHGWQSLVPVEGSAGYRYTNPQTQHELHRLIHTVVRPLGPTLVQVERPQGKVALLESLASEVFAKRGTYGWNGSWAGDAFLICEYAHLEPEVVYDETIAQRGLDGYQVLVMPDCDVLTQTVADKVREFQRNGGIVIGDERTAPGIQPDLTIELYERTKAAFEDKQALLARAAKLRQDLAGRYQRPFEADNPEVIVHRRAAGASDYLFVVNDRREYGTYVGHHKLVMENGLPSSALLTLRRPAGYVYDLVDGVPVEVEAADGALRFPVDLGPCDGRVFLVTAEPIAGVTVEAPAELARGAMGSCEVAVVDPNGQAIDAVVPVEVHLRDAEGRDAEFSGYYGAPGGRLSIALEIAPNEEPGTWTIEVRELASQRVVRRYLRVTGG